MTPQEAGAAMQHFVKLGKEKVKKKELVGSLISVGRAYFVV